MVCLYAYLDEPYFITLLYLKAHLPERFLHRRREDFQSTLSLQDQTIEEKCSVMALHYMFIAHNHIYNIRPKGRGIALDFFTLRVSRLEAG